jgi:Ca-activated chloride channel homolog
MSWFTNPLGLLAFAGIPAVLALHLYRQRHLQVPVSSLFLWLSPEARESSGRTRQPLRRTPSFWMELFAALLIALFISGFDPLSNNDAKHLIVVLDDSASMSADTVKTELNKRFEEELDEQGRRTRVTLIRSGVRPSLLCGPGALIPEAREAMQTWQPTSPGHDPRPAISLARELALGGEIWFMTDHALATESTLGDEVRVLGFGTQAANMALIEARRTKADIVHCTARLYDAAALTNATPQSNKLQIFVGEELMLEREFEAAPNKDVHFEFPLPEGTPAVRLQLQPDAVAVDNSATLYPNPDRTVYLGYQLDDGLQEALRLQDFADALPEVKITQQLEAAHLVFAHDAAPTPAWSVVVPHPADASADAEAFIHGFLPEKRHSLLRGLTFEGILWSRAKAFAPKGLPLLSVGDLALISETAVGNAVIYMVNLLPLRSTLVQSPDWPILVSNLVEMRRAALQGPQEVNLVAGQAFEFRHQGRAQFELQGVGAKKSLKTDGNLRLDDLAPHPAYVLSLQEKPLVRFAVNFIDPAESDLGAADTFEQPPLLGETVLAQQGYAESPMGRILLLLFVGLLIANWLYLGKRRSA